MRTLPILAALTTASRCALVTASLVLAAPTARAGTYEHLTLSAASPGSDGWSPRVRAPGGFVATAAAPGLLSARFWARPWFAPGELAEWVYTAPAGTTVAGWQIERAVSGVGGGDWNTLFTATVDGRLRHVAHDVPSVNRAWGRIAASGLGAGSLSARLQCGGPHACPAGGGPLLRLRAARISLHDPYAPRVSAVRGDLAGDNPLTGTAALSFAATDRGGGVFRAFADVDGRRVATVPIGDARCRDLVAGAGREFAHRAPCPLTAGATVPVDTRRLSDGRHVIAVHVEDAAGNRTTVHGPTAVTVTNATRRPTPPPPRPIAPPPAVTRPTPPPPAAAGRMIVTAWLERGHRRRRAVTVPHGERVRLRGRITDTTGHPLPGAALGIAERIIDGSGRPFAVRRAAIGGPAATRGAWRPVTGVRARANGRFTAFTRIGPSRRIRVTAPGGSRAPRLTLRVRAPIAARAVRRGGRLLVRGRLRGGFVPGRGALVELQTRVRRRWTTRLVLRTWRSGRFAGRVPAGAVRVKVPRQPGLPYAAGRLRVSPPRRAGRTAARTSR